MLCGSSKRAYSIAETLVTLFIVAVVFVLAAPSLSKKRLALPGFYEKHGIFVCTNPSCTFRPKKGANDLYIIAAGGSGGGAGSDCGKSSRYYSRAYIPNDGWGAEEAKDIFDTVVFDVEKDAVYELEASSGGGAAYPVYLENRDCERGPNNESGGSGFRVKASFCSKEQGVLGASLGREGYHAEFDYRDSGTAEESFVILPKEIENFKIINADRGVHEEANRTLSINNKPPGNDYGYLMCPNPNEYICKISFTKHIDKSDLRREYKTKDHCYLLTGKAIIMRGGGGGDSIHSMRSYEGYINKIMHFCSCDKCDSDGIDEETYRSFFYYDEYYNDGYIISASGARGGSVYSFNNGSGYYRSYQTGDPPYVRLSTNYLRWGRAGKLAQTKAGFFRNVKGPIEIKVGKGGKGKKGPGEDGEDTIVEIKGGGFKYSTASTQKLDGKIDTGADTSFKIEALGGKGGIQEEFHQPCESEKYFGIDKGEVSPTGYAYGGDGGEGGTLPDRCVKDSQGKDGSDGFVIIFY